MGLFVPDVQQPRFEPLTFPLVIAGANLAVGKFIVQIGKVQQKLFALFGRGEIGPRR